MSAFKHINAGDAKALFEQGNVAIADIRDAMSFDAGHIRTAIRVDNQSLSQFIAATDKDQPLVVCCYHGNSSQGAAQFFGEQGYTNVYSLDGGYEMWKLAFPEWCEHNG